MSEATCTWTHHNAMVCMAGCRKQYWHYVMGCNFCPFCGKPLNVVWPMVGAGSGVTPIPKYELLNVGGRGILDCPEIT